MKTFQIRLEALAAVNAITGQPVPALSESFAVQAADRTEARRFAYRDMTIRPSGQELKIYIDDTLALGNH